MIEVAVWLLRIDDIADAIAARCANGSPVLIAEDMAYVRRQPDATRRRAAEATRTALRMALRRKLGVYAANQPIAPGPFGKPLLPAGIGAFSISHTERTALIAVTDAGSVGIDIEAARDLSFSAERREKIRAAADSFAGAPLTGDDHGLLQGWTRLEAVAKARGSGIGRLLGDVGIWGPGSGDNDAGGVAAASTALAAAEVISTHDLDLPPELYGAVALQPANGEVVITVERMAASQMLG